MTEYNNSQSSTYTDTQHLTDHENLTTLQNIQLNNFIGDPFKTPKPPNTFRVHAGNPNGIRVHRHSNDYDEYLITMKTLETDCVLLYEINLDTHKAAVKKILHETTKSHFDFSRLTYSSSAIPSVNDFKPGGTLLLTQGDSTGRIIHTGTDELGRWSHQTLVCKNNKLFTIISAYQVCEQNIRNSQKVAALTAYAQQVSLLRMQGRQEDPRKAFISDLRLLINQLQSRDHSILLIGDFNDTLDEHYEGITKLASDCHLKDLMYSEIGDSDFATWIRGSSRIDFVLADAWIVEAVDNACYLPFLYHTKGDHRNIVIDFNYQRLFGQPQYKLSTPSMREFSSKDRKAVRKYITERYRYLSTHRFEERLAALETTWKKELAESLDSDHIRACKKGAVSSKRRPNLAYVQQIAELRKQKNILLRVISTMTTGISIDDSLNLLVQGCSTPIIPDNRINCQQKIRELQKQIKQLEKQAVPLRREDLKRQLLQKEAQGDKAGAKDIKRIIMAENIKLMFRKLRSFKQHDSSGITRVEVPTDKSDRNYKQCQSWISVDTPKEVEEALTDKIKHHFAQAEGTFPTIPPYSEWVNWSASSHTAELILEGDFHPDSLEHLQYVMIKHMKKQTDLDSITDTLTEAEWKGKIKAWGEDTSTSPSGFHLTHSKALLAQHDLQIDTPEGQILERQREQLISWQVRLINVAIINGYSFDRWKYVANVMILKEPGNIKIHRLRIIHLYEHDYNMILAIKWRALIQRSTQHKLLNKGQFGSIPGCDAISPTIIEELQYEICRASKRPLVHIDWDAMACYDRIILPFSSILERAQGLHRNLVQVNANTLQDVKLILKTQLGMSESIITHTETSPIYGSGQGAGNSPGKWAVISSALFNAYEEEAKGALFKSPDESTAIKIFMVGFVDDTSSSINDFTQPYPLPPEAYIQLATSDAQRWNDLLKLSGGALEDTKCSYHFLYFDFTISGLPVLRAGNIPPFINIYFNNNIHKTPLIQKSSHSAHKTLGTHKAPSGTMQQSHLHIGKKNKMHARLIACNPFDRIDSWVYYHSIYLPSLTYPLSSGYLSESQLTKLQIEVKQVLLPKYGFNRNTPNAIVYGPTELAGISLRTLFIEQGILQLLALLKCLRSEGAANKLIHIAILWAQHLSGIGEPIFQATQISLPHLDPMKWIPSIRSFLSKMNLRLRMQPYRIPKPQRENDVYLMEIAATLPFTDTEMKLLNACRLFLGVTFLSDISSVQGHMLLESSYNGIIPNHSISKGLNAYQDNPSPKSWNLWKKLLRVFTTQHTLQLSTPLGRWYQTGSNTHRLWNFYVHPDGNTVYRREDHQFTILQKIDRSYIDTGKSNPFPHPNSTPTEIIDSHISQQIPRAYPISKKTPPNSFLSFIDELPEWESEILQGISFRKDVYHFCQQALNTSYLIATSDGSAPHFIGSFGWSCATAEGCRLANNKGPAKGYRTSSFRAEAYGILSLLRFIFRAFEYTGTEYPEKICLYTDSLSLVQKIFSHSQFHEYYPNATMDPEWDILQAIKLTRKTLPTNLSIDHVKGHQDNHTSVSRLSLQAQLNVEADKLAAEYIYPEIYQAQQCCLITGNTVQLESEQGTITSNIRQHIRHLATTKNLQTHIKKQQNWDDRTFHLADWEIHGICVRKVYHRRHFFTKFIHDILPLGPLINKYNRLHTTYCPTCPMTFETRTHFLTCPSRSLLGTLHQKLTHYMDKHSTAPILKDLIIDGIHSWYYDPEVQINPQTYPKHVQFLIQDQNKLGWIQILLGRFARGWREIQHSHLCIIAGDSQQTATTWLVGVIITIWDVIYSMWEIRNQSKHGHDITSQNEILITQARAETTALYQSKSLVLPRDTDIFYSTLTEHFEKEDNPTKLRQWLNTWRPNILRSIGEKKKLGLSNTPNITNFFTRKPQTYRHERITRRKDKDNPRRNSLITQFFGRQQNTRNISTTDTET